MGVGHLGDKGLVWKRHGKSGDGVFLESLVKISQRLSGLNLQAVVDETGLTVSLTYIKNKKLSNKINLKNILYINFKNCLTWC